MRTLRWLRVPGDTVFALGAFILVGFVFTTRSPKTNRPVVAADRAPALAPVAIPAVTKG
jgi:hypothetical protein